MSEVEFTDEAVSRAHSPQGAASGLPALVLKWGLAKDEKEATKVLLWIAAGAAIIAIGAFLFMPEAKPAEPQFKAGQNVLVPAAAP